MASQLLGIKTRFTNDLGSPLVGGQVYTFFAGTSTPQDTYSDAALTIPNTNPVILDDTGSADIFLKGAYRIRVFDKSGRFIEEQDNVTQAASQGDATELSNKVTTLESDLSTANTELNKVKLDTGITATAKYGGVSRNLSDVLSEKRRTPRDFGALGGVNDDTSAVIACINTGYFLIDEHFTVKPFTISGKELDGKFTRNGKLNITESTGQDSVTFFECSGIISGLNAHENYSSGSWATIVFSRCEDMTINKPTIKDGKIIGLCVQNCTNTHVYNGKGNATASQSWYLISCIDSTMNFCKLKNEGSGFYIIGGGYKSGTNNRSEIDEQLSTGMAMNYCYADVASLGFDINGAVGAELFKCVGNQNFKDTAAAVFQVKQSTNVASETKRLTQKNKVTQCVAIKCSRGFATQNGEDVVFKDNYILGSKGSGIVLNDTPRVTIDGLYCYDLFQQNAAISEDVSIVTTSSTSSSCNIRNVQLVQRVLPEDASKVVFFNVGGSSSSLSNFTMDVSGAVVANTTKIKALCRNTGINFTYGDGIKPLVATMYTNIILDETSSAIYPRTFTHRYAFNKDVTGTTYFDIPERGLAVGNVRVFTSGTVTGVKLAVGSSASIAGLYGLKEPATGLTVTPPVTGFVADSLPLATRLELASAVSGTAIIQVRGIDLY